MERRGGEEMYTELIQLLLTALIMIGVPLLLGLGVILLLHLDDVLTFGREKKNKKERK